MPLTRTINVITLACLLFLTGCFGLTNDTITPEADGQTTASNGNHAPFIDTASLLNNVMYTGESSQRDISYDPTTGNEILNGFNLSLHHAAIDIDGDAMTMGWDINLDGSVDVPTTVASGTTDLSIGIEHWTDVSSLIDEEGYYQAIVAFIAIDEHGAGNAEFVEVWGWDYDDDDDDDNSGGGGLTLYVFDAEDAQDSPSSATDDPLIRVTMSQGSDINWAVVSVKISVNNGAPLTCANDNASKENSPCWLYEFGSTSDHVWSVGDGVTIYENSAICDASVTCNIEVTISDTQAEKTIDQSTAVAS